MANDKKFIVKNGLLTPENAVIGSNTDTGEQLQVTGDTVLTQATAGTPTLKVTNTGGNNAVIGQFEGDAAALQVKNLATGDYQLVNTGNNNGIIFYNDTGGVSIQYNGGDRLVISNSGNEFSGLSNTTIDGNRILTTADEGSGNGLDADTVDGLEAAQFVRADVDDIMAGNYTIQNDLTIQGDLTVSGNTTYVNTEEILLSDNIITINANYSGSNPTENGGIEVERGSLNNAKVIWNESQDYWQLEVNGSVLGRIITTADEGPGNGFDADTVDGLEGSQFLRSDVDDTAQGNITIEGDLTIGDNGGPAQIFFDGQNNNRTLYSNNGEIGFLNNAANWAMKSDANGDLEVERDVEAGRDVTADRNIVADDNITATTGNIAATAGNVTAGDSMTAQNNITATTGNIDATAGNVTAGNDITAGQDITATAGSVTAQTNVTAVTGNVTATAGDVIAGDDVVAGDDITATAGDISATAGNVTAGDSMTAQNNITATTGNIAATAGNVTAGDSITAQNDITATTGDISASAGSVSAATTVTAGTDVIGQRFVDADNNSYLANPSGTSVFNDLGIDDDLFHNGDTDTKIQFTTDDISLQTGGSERLGIDNTGVQITGDLDVDGDISANNGVFTGDLSASRFTDADDNNYFADPNATSVMKTIGIDDYIQHNGDTDTYFGFNANDNYQIFTGGTQRLEVNGTYLTSAVDGIFPNLYAGRYYDSSNATYYGDFASTSRVNDISLVGEIIHDGDTDTYIHFPAANQFEAVIGGNQRFFVNGTYALATNQMRSPIYYDSNNTNYYGDFASTSQMAQIDIDSYIRHRGDTDTYLGFSAGNTIDFYAGGGHRARINNTVSIFYSDIQANRFVDRNNTSYYVNPGDASLSATFAGGVRIDAISNYSRWDDNSGNGGIALVGHGDVGDGNSSHIAVSGQYTGGYALMYLNRIDPTSNPFNNGNRYIAFRADGASESSIRGDSSGNLYLTPAASGNIGFWTSGGNEVAVALDDGNFVVGGSSVTYTVGDGTPVVGGALTNNKLHVNGSIQLTSGDDALVIGRGTATFLKDEELGFGWGGGWYMTDGTYIRSRNNKHVYTTGSYYGNVYYSYQNTAYYADPDGYSQFAGLDVDDYIRHRGDTNTFLRFPSNDFITLGTNNTARLNISNSTVRARNKFEVYGPGIEIQKASNGGGVGITITDQNGGSENPGLSGLQQASMKVWHADNSVTSGANLAVVWESSEPTTHYVFSTNNNAAGGNIIPRVTNSGSIGLSNYRWNAIYAQNANFSGDVTGDNAYFNRYYDAGDNAYYADPASTSIFKHLTLNNPAGDTILKFGPGLPANDDAHIEWKGTSNSGYLRFSTSDDSGNEYMEFGDYDNTDRGGAFTRWARMQRTYFQHDSQLRSPYFYASDNTAYYVDPNGDSQLNTIDIDDYIRHRGDTNTYIGFDGNDRFRVWTNGTQRLNIDNNSADFAVNVYAPRYYDSNDNAFYTDPAGTSLQRRLNLYSGESTGEFNVGRGSTQRFRMYVTDSVGYIQYYQDETGGTDHSVQFDINSSSSGANEFRFNRPINLTGSGSASYIYARRFIDKDNTSYYVDPASNSFMASVTLQQNPVGQAYYGVATQPTYYFGQQRGDNDAWKIYGESPSGSNTGNLILQSEDDYDSNESIRFRFKRTYSAYDTNDVLQAYYNYVMSPNSFRAPIFYDSNNTGFYGDFAGTSNLNRLHLGGVSSNFVDGNDPHLSAGNAFFTQKVVTPRLVFLNDASGDDNYIFADDNNNASSVAGVSMGAWYYFVGDKISATANQSAGIIASGIRSVYGEFTSQIRSPIFYDNNNTGYYVDPASTSRLNHINANTIDTDVGLKDGTNYSLQPYYLGQVLFSGGHAGTGGSTFDVARHKNATLYGRNGSTWTNLGNCDGILDGLVSHQWGGLTLSRTYQEFIIWFGNNLGYSFCNAVAITHSTNGNNFDVYLESKESVTNPWDSGFTTHHSRTGQSSWPGGTVITGGFNVGAGYNDNFRIRIVPNWTHASNSISLGSIQIFAAYGSFSRSYYTDFNRNLIADVSMRSPIFYDQNNTGYYVDPASNSRFNTTQALRYYMNHGTSYWIDEASGNYGSIMTGGRRSGWAGYSIEGNYVFMANTGEMGIYNDIDNEWMLYGQRNAQIQFYYNGGVQAQTASGYFLANNQMRAPIYYDSNNTTYYLNPAAGNTDRSLMISGRIFRQNFQTSGGGDNNKLLEAQDYSHWIWNTATNWGIFWAGNNNAAYTHFSTSNPNEIVFVGAGNVRASIDLDNGNAHFNGTLSAGSFALNGGNENIELVKSYGSGGADLVLFDGTEYFDKRVIKAMAPNESALTSNTSEFVRTTNGPFAGSYVLQSSGYRTFYSDYIPVAPGEDLYGEISCRRVSGSGGLLYYGIERFDSQKRPIAGNTGTTYFVVSANNVTSTNWVTFRNHTTIPTTHTPYNGSDGGGCYYVRIRILMNYNSGGALRQFAGIMLKRRNAESNLLVDDLLADDITADEISANIFRDRAAPTTYYVDPASISYFNDIRPNIMYDRNNTGYYIDPASTSRWNASNQNSYHTFNNYGIGITGTYTSTRLQQVFAMGSSYRLPADGNSTANMYGIAWSHPNAGSKGGANNLNDHGMLIINNGSFRAAISSRAVFSQDVRGTLFYDYNNTGYYVDPASTSRMVHLRLSSGDSYLKIGSNSATTTTRDGNRPQIEIGNGHAYPHFTLYSYGSNTTHGGVISFRSRQGGGFRRWNIGTANYNPDSIQIGYFDNQNNPHYGVGVNGWTYDSYSRFVIRTSYSEARGDFRSPLFYDLNNTGYYVDPASTSVMNSVRAQRFSHVDDVSQNDQFGLYFGANQSTAYAIFREGGSWTYPYPDLRIAFHTGIKFGANASYQGMRFYTDYNMATQVMSINNGSDPLGGSNVYVNNNLQAGSSLRAPIFYDSNNTGYYVDPASTSHMNTLTLRGNRLGFVNTSFDAEIRVSDANPDGTGADFVLWGDQVQYNARLITEVVHATRHMRAPIYYDANNASYYLHPDGVSYLNDIRPNIMYDRNNTGYYVDPASTSRFNAINVNNIKDEASPDYGGVYFDNRNGSYEPASPTNTTYRGQKIGTGLAIYSGYSTGSNRPFTYDMSAQFNLSGIAFEIAIDWVQGDRTPMKVRSLRDCCIGWSNWTDIATSGVSFTNNQDLRAPIFYDSNDTSYYANPNGNSRFNTMQFTGDVNFDGGAGAIEITSSDIRSNGNSSWTGNPGSGVGKIQMHSNRWYIVSNGNSNRIVQFRQNGSDRSYIQNDGRFIGNVTAPNDARAPIFYDNNDTGYYIDPNSTSNSSFRQRGGTLHGPNPTWGAYLAVGTNGHWSGSYASVMTTNGNLHLDSASGRDLYLQWYVGRTVYVSGAIQATIYYDRNNTSYYADMASTSNFNDFRANIVYDRSNTAYYVHGSSGDASMRTITADRLNMRDRGDFITFYGDDSTYHSISSRDNGGGVTDDLRFNSYHDIFFNLDSNNNNSTGSTGFYIGQHGAATGSISGWAFQAMADGNSYSNSSFRTYTFYAREDTAYYVDPNGTARLRAVYANDWFRADGGSGLYFQDYGYGVRGAQAEGNPYGNISTYGNGRGGWSGYGIDRKWTIMSSGNGNSNNFGVHNTDSSWLWYWNGSYTNTRLGYLNNESSMRAPIFYDSNNTGYYFNGASQHSTRFEGVNNRTMAFLNKPGHTRNSGEYYRARPRQTSDTNYWTGAMGWGRVDMNAVATWGSGFIDSWSNPPNQPSGTSHWVGCQAFHYRNSNTSGYGWQMVGGPITNLRFRSSWSGWRSWRTIPVLDENNGNGGGMYAGAYYDANDSGYYLDPNSTSNQALRVRGGILHGPNTSWGQYLYVGGNGHWTSSYASVVATNGNLHIDPQSGDHLYFNYYVNGMARFYNGSGAERFRVDTNGIVYAFSQFRTPIAYDYNNTGYYSDPASTSQFNVTRANRYAFRGTGGNSGQSIGNAYELFQTSGSWSYPYPALRINYHTGIDLGANASYNGFRFMNDYNSNTVRFQINGGSNYTYANTWINIGGGGVGIYEGYNGAHFYPNNQTSYGAWAVQGSRNGYHGVAYNSAGYDPHDMWDGSGNGGWYLQGLGRWVFYHNRSRNCTGVGSSSTVSGYRMRVNGSLYCNGNVVAYSDRRKKKNIVTIDNALDKVLQLRGVYYERKEDLIDDRDDLYKGRQIGMIAQEVQEIIPEVVSYAEEIDEYGLDYPKMVGLLVEAHKDQQKLINSQQEKIDKLEEMVYNLMNKLEDK